MTFLRNNGRTPTILRSAMPLTLSPTGVRREFTALLQNGFSIRPVGDARRAPHKLLADRYAPLHRLDLHAHRFYLSRLLYTPDVRFFVAFVVPEPRTRSRPVHPRIFYEDSSMAWRSASHIYVTRTELWLGKGDASEQTSHGYIHTSSMEWTTDLPTELHVALDTLCGRWRRPPFDEGILPRILRRAPDHRVMAYKDFTEPRRRATRQGASVAGGRPVARFLRRNDPGSLVFLGGYEPDFRAGIFEVARSDSVLYGRVARFRVLSTNRRLQYQFILSKKHAFVLPPQGFGTELSSYGVRTQNVVFDELLCVPGYEYHFMDKVGDEPTLHTQIPRGFAAAPCPLDPNRADASPWLEALPVIKKFRATLARRNRALLR